jgi:hypothetical protein
MAFGKTRWPQTRGNPLKARRVSLEEVFSLASETKGAQAEMGFDFTEK